jgi:hypothetical protein
MVAHSQNTDTSPEQHMGVPPHVRSHQYAHSIDAHAAGIEGDAQTGTATLTPLVFHEAFARRPKLTKAEQRELAIKQAALRIAAGMEMRSLRELALEIGCSHTAIDNCIARLCDRVGMRKFHVSDSTRQKQSEARQRQLARH